jgi:hypothetical protein
VLLVGLLKLLADPNPGCTYDCIGRLILLLVGAVALIAWEPGPFAGAFHRHVREKRGARMRLT